MLEMFKMTFGHLPHYIYDEITITSTYRPKSGIAIHFTTQ